MVASFSEEKISSDGGLLTLKEIENQIGIIQSITNFISDNRHPSHIDHTLKKLIAQRVYQIEAGGIKKSSF